MTTEQLPADLATRLVEEWAADRLTQPTAAERDFAMWIVELLEHDHESVSRALRRCCDLHRLSPVGSCCDPDDCGPCCSECPTCPTVFECRIQEDMGRLRRAAQARRETAQ